MTVDDTTCSLAGPTTCVIIILGAVADGACDEFAMTSAANNIAQSLTRGAEFRLTVAIWTYNHSGTVASPAI